MPGPPSSFCYCGCTWFAWLSNASDVNVKHNWDLKDWSFSKPFRYKAIPELQKWSQDHQEFKVILSLAEGDFYNTGLQETLSQRQEQELHIFGWDQDFYKLNSATYQGFIKIQNGVVGTNMPNVLLGDLASQFPWNSLFFLPPSLLPPLPQLFPLSLPIFPLSPSFSLFLLWTIIYGFEQDF